MFSSLCEFKKKKLLTKYKFLRNISRWMYIRDKRKQVNQEAIHGLDTTYENPVQMENLQVTHM